MLHLLPRTSTSPPPIPTDHGHVPHSILATRPPIPPNPAPPPAVQSLPNLPFLWDRQSPDWPFPLSTFSIRVPFLWDRQSPDWPFPLSTFSIRVSHLASPLPRATIPRAMGEQPTTSPSDRPSSQITAEPPRYCRRCNYNLHGLTAPRCPECGREFDPTNPKTYRSRPARGWAHYAKRAAYALAVLLLLLVGIWGWFFWGWYDEQQALRALQVDPENVDHVQYTPILTYWPKEHLGPAGFVLDRVTYFGASHDRNPPDFTPLAKLTKLKLLDLESSSITDLAPLAELTELRFLGIRYTRVSDLSPLARLTKLEQLYVGHTAIKDLTPVAGLTELHQLSLPDTAATDVTPLARLTKLTGLYLQGNRITDFTPLAGLKTLRRLSVPDAGITAEQLVALQRALPDCKIERR